MGEVYATYLASQLNNGVKSFFQFLTEQTSALDVKFDALLKRQKPLSPDAQEMMDEWMDGFSSDVNAFIRGEKKDPGMKKFVDQYDKIIEEHGIVLDEPLTVYRSTPHGKSVTHEGFLSTTLDPKFAVGIAAGREIPEWSEKAKEHKIMRITIPKGTRVLPVGAKHTRGRKTGDYSGEFEIIIPRRSRLNVNPKAGKVQVGKEFRDLHDATLESTNT